MGLGHVHRQARREWKGVLVKELGECGLRHKFTAEGESGFPLQRRLLLGSSGLGPGASSRGQERPLPGHGLQEAGWAPGRSGEGTRTGEETDFLPFILPLPAPPPRPRCEGTGRQQAAGKLQEVLPGGSCARTVTALLLLERRKPRGKGPWES